MEHINFHIRGIAPLLMHNVRLADPLDPIVKEIQPLARMPAAKKSDDIHAQIAVLEFKGGMYFEQDIGPYIPARMLDKMLYNGGTVQKIGKIITEATLSVEDRSPLLYEGPRTMDALYEAGFYDRRAIGIGRSKTIRTRPMFPEWELKFSIAFDTERLDSKQIIDAAAYAGRYKGIGDFRPRFGRFELVNGV